MGASLASYARSGAAWWAPRDAEAGAAAPAGEPLNAAVDADASPEFFARCALACWASHAAYLDCGGGGEGQRDSAAAAALRRWPGVEPGAVFTDHHVQLCVARLRGAAGAPDGGLVAVQGTHGLHTALLDAECGLADAPALRCRAHRGFAAVAESAGAAVDAALRELGVADGDAVSFCGHSLGGALALLLAMRRAGTGARVGHVTTLGQPRVTDHDGAAAWAPLLPVLRLRGTDDPVPCVPARPLYQHFGAQVDVRGDGSYCALQGAAASADGNGDALGLGSLAGIAQHHLSAYAGAVAAMPGAAGVAAAAGAPGGLLREIADPAAPAAAPESPPAGDADDTGFVLIPGGGGRPPK